MSSADIIEVVQDAVEFTGQPDGACRARSSPSERQRSRLSV